MEPIKVYVSGADTTVVYAPVITAGTVGQPVQFSFDKAWDGLTKTAVFHAGNVTRDRVAITDETTVPAEVLAPANAGTILEIGIYGTDIHGVCVIPSRMAEVDHIQVGADPSGDEGIEPELPLWQQALARFEQTNHILQDVESVTREARSVTETLQKAYENGEFVGPKGEPGDTEIDDESIDPSKTWSSEKLDEEFDLRGGGRFGKYDAKTPGWKRILNIIRATSGTLNVGLVQPSLGYSMTQYAMLDIGGCVQFHNDRNTPTARPIIRQRMNHMYGEDNATADPSRQAKITKVRIAYPKRDATYPIPDSEGVYKTAANPINCYVDVYLDFDPEWKNNGYDVTRSFIYNFSGMTDSHNCTAITEEMDATDIGMYGEELEFYEYELKEDTELDAEFSKVTAQNLMATAAELTAANIQEFATKTLYVKDALGNVYATIANGEVNLQPLKGINIGTRGLHTQSSNTPVLDANGNAVTNNAAFGWACEANASCAFSAGVKSKAEAYGAATIGLYLRALFAGQIILGKYNAYENDALKNVLLAIGNGTSDTARSNAFVVKQDGSVDIAGELSVGSIAPETLQMIVDAVLGDEDVGNVSRALDEIIELQQRLINGEETVNTEEEE